MQILADFQGANLRILSREGNLFHIAPDLRDGDDWFYRAFHLCGEPGETFSCDFGEDKIGYYGPAVSRTRNGTARGRRSPPRWKRLISERAAFPSRPSAP